MQDQGYPRPDVGPGGIYPPDKIWGAVIIFFSVLGICLGGCAVVGGGMLGALGATAAATAPNHNSAAGSAAAAAGGGFVMVMGVVLAALSAARLYGGILIMKSKKLGFMLAGACSAISILLSLIGFRAYSVIGIVISAVVVYYCYARITGKMGPPALD